MAASLAARGVRSTFVGITTTGDVDQRDLTQIGGTGVFVGAVREALYDGRVDLAVHSLKDLPTAPATDLRIAAVPHREDVRDVLVGLTLDRLGDGSRIGTGSPRRAMQLRAYAREAGARVEIIAVRGNVDTRMALVRAGRLDAVLLAAAGLVRLGHLEPRAPGAAEAEERVWVGELEAQILSPRVMLPAPGQGALALEIHRSLREPLAAAIGSLDDPRARAESLAERGFLAALEAGCTAPVGAHAVLEGVRGNDLDLTLDAVVGRTLLSNTSDPLTAGTPMRRQLHGTSPDPEQFGAAAARQVLEEL